MKSTLSLLIVLNFLFSCTSGNSSKEESLEDKVVENQLVISEDELISHLSSHFIAVPENQFQKEQNKIINYAIDNLLNVSITKNGIFYLIKKSGQGNFIKWGDKVKVHYKGYFMDGAVFDSSYEKGKPIEFYVGNMIDGWNEGLQLLQPGATALFLIPSALAYKEEGLKDKKDRTLVPPNTVLIFELEVLELVD